jgi:hypothetical protein
MTLRSLISGPVNSLRHTNTNIAKPVAPVIVSAALTGADATTTAIAFTQPTIGMPATSFTATSTPGSITRTSSTSPITYELMALNPNTSYTFAVSAVGANGTGPSSTTGSVATDDSYVLLQTFDSSATFTVPAGASKIAVFAVGGGSGGVNGGGQSSTSNHIGGHVYYGAGGAGGASSALATFKDQTVTPADTYAVSIGAAGNAASAGGTTSFGSLLSVTGNTVTGNATNLQSLSTSGGGAGGGGAQYDHIYGEGSNYYIGAAGSVNNTPVTLSSNLTGLGSVSITGGNGGAGGGGSATTNNVGAGNGGGIGQNGGVGTLKGQGGGGSGAGAGSGAVGTAGQVKVYVRY